MAELAAPPDLCCLCVVGRCIAAVYIFLQILSLLDVRGGSFGERAGERRAGGGVLVMCILFYAHGVFPTRRVMLIHNRDEDVRRATAEAEWWDDHPQVRTNGATFMCTMSIIVR